jgi:OOP family OmpA-OmpF porin
VPAELITTVFRGEGEPAVPTADGVREQANRRVEIIIQ